MQTIFVDGYWKGYARKAMQSIQDITHHQYKHIIEQRIKIITFFDDYGAEATARAFGTGRSTVYGWKKILKDNGGRIVHLAPKSTKPKTLRCGATYTWHSDRILSIRSQHPGLGKDKVHALLCDEIDRLELVQLPRVSVSTVGRIITGLQKQGSLPDRRQLTFLARTGRLVPKQSKPRLAKLRRGSYMPQRPGDLVQIDCVIKIIGGLRRYVVSAVDYRTSFAFSYGYTTLSSTSTTDFLVKLQQVVPFTVRRMQTDNGSEFYKHFHNACTEMDIVHFWNYPRTPKSNGKIERYNRTVQEEFVDWNLDDLAYDMSNFNMKLADWLIWYNTTRPHWTHNLQSPMKHLLQLLQLPTLESEMCWTDTRY